MFLDKTLCLLFLFFLHPNQSACWLCFQSRHLCKLFSRFCIFRSARACVRRCKEAADIFQLILEQLQNHNEIRILGTPCLLFCPISCWTEHCVVWKSPDFSPAEIISKAVFSLFHNRFFAFLKKSFASPNSRVSDTCGTFREMWIQIWT